LVSFIEEGIESLPGSPKINMRSEQLPCGGFEAIVPATD